MADVAAIRGAPCYDTEWSARGVQNYLTHTTIPTLTEGGFWDQEDGNGPQMSCAALGKTDTAHISNLLIGPWYHGPWFENTGDSLAAIQFCRPTGLDFQTLQARFFVKHLKQRTVDAIPEATLFAATTGSDADWVVKPIDLFPDSVTRREMRGYEQMVASDVMRGRYRTSFAKAEAIPPKSVLPCTVDLHSQAYTFRAGHRIMVQVQRAMFPSYDRNPQTFVPNIFTAAASDYRARTHAVHRSARWPSRVDVQVLRQRCRAARGERGA